MRENILITGGSTGLGAEMARQFAAKGYNLALCARRTDMLETLKAEILAAHPTAVVLIKPLDVGDYEAVFSVVREFDAEFIAETGSGIDRFIVNAGIGTSQKIGAGRFLDNKKTAEINFVAAIAQCEAAMELFYQRNAGHLVIMSSISAVRGMKGVMATYAASKAAVANLAEGIRLDVLSKPNIAVTTIFPGYILTAINEKVENAPFRVGPEKGVATIVKAIEKEVSNAQTPAWPWKPIGWLMRAMPLKMLKKF